MSTNKVHTNLPKNFEVPEKNKYSTLESQKSTKYISPAKKMFKSQKSINHVKKSILLVFYFVEMMPANNPNIFLKENIFLNYIVSDGNLSRKKTVCDTFP